MNGFEVEGGERMEKEWGLTPLTASGNAHGHRRTKIPPLLLSPETG